MTHAGYVLAGYGLTFGTLGAYAAWLLLRRRALTRALAPVETRGEASGGAVPDHR